MPQGNCVLLAGNTPEIIKSIKKTIRSGFPEHRLQVVADGSEVLAYLSGLGAYANRTKYPAPSLVILDTAPPGIDSLTVLAWIRRESQRNTLPVIVLTTDGTAQRAYELGANSCIRRTLLIGRSPALEATLTYWLTVNELPR